MSSSEAKDQGRAWMRTSFSTAAKEVRNGEDSVTSGSPQTGRRWLRRWRWRILAAYLALVVVSHVVRAIQARDQGFDNDDAAVTVQAVDAGRRAAKSVRIAYKEYRPGDGKDYPAVLLLHGSPGGKDDFDSLAPDLARNYRVIVPDLPGFGNSTRD